MTDLCGTIFEEIYIHFNMSENILYVSISFFNKLISLPRTYCIITWPARTFNFMSENLYIICRPFFFFFTLYYVFFYTTSSFAELEKKRDYFDNLRVASRAMILYIGCRKLSENWGQSVFLYGVPRMDAVGRQFELDAAASIPPHVVGFSYQ